MEVAVFPKKFKFSRPDTIGGTKSRAKTAIFDPDNSQLKMCRYKVDILSIQSELQIQAFYLDIVKINFSPLGKVNRNISLHNKPPVRSLPLSIRIVKFQVEIPENLRNHFVDLLNPVSSNISNQGGENHK